MKLYIALALGGLPIGAMYALQALGIVIVYKTSRVFNFATGAIGLACAYNASSMVSHGVPIGFAILIAVGLGVLIGVLMELTVRPVRRHVVVPRISPCEPIPVRPCARTGPPDTGRTAGGELRGDEVHSP